MRRPTSVSKLNPNNVYSIQSDEASVVCLCLYVCVCLWVGGGGGIERKGERGRNISQFSGGGTQLIQLPPSSGKILQVCRRTPKEKSYSYAFNMINLTSSLLK